MPTNNEQRTTSIRLGLSSYTYGWAVGVRGHEPPLTLDEHGLLDKCLEHGLKLLQIGDNLPLHSFDDARLKRLAERAAREGVQLEVGARGLTVKRVAQYAAIARRLDATLIRFVIDEAGYHPAPDEIIGVLRTAEPLLDGLTLGIENHDRFPAATLRSIIDAIFSDRIGVCLDTANSLGAGEDIVRVAAALAPVTVNLHVKDFSIERVPHAMGFTVSGRPAGAGILDLPSVLRRIEPFGRCATAVLELWTPPELDIERTVAKEEAWAAQSLAYLKPLFITSA
jgi:sugar phosphate isomerase/epimerase